MAGLVNQYQQGAFTTPVNATVADATVVLSNDNATRGKHNSHDADATIHIQSSTLATMPAAGTAQRVWVTTDGLRAYIDSGAAWQELAYLSLAAGGTVAAATTFSAGLTVSSGTSALQAVTATTGTYSSQLAVGSQFASSPTALNISLNRTASSGLAFGYRQVATYAAAANADDLRAMMVAPTFTGGTFTNVTAYGLRIIPTWSGSGSSSTQYGIYVDDVTGAVTNVSLELVNVLRGDKSSTAGDTRLLVWDVTAGALVRVTRGAADSGGAGFRLLRVPN